MSRDTMIDDAISKAKDDGDMQLAYWLRTARGSDAAARWYTGKLREVQAENAKLRELAVRFADYVGQDRCEGCVTKTRCNEGLIDECWLLTEIREIADGLGIEVER